MAAKSKKCVAQVWVVIFLIAVILVNRLLFSSRKLGHFMEVILERGRFGRQKAEGHFSGAETFPGLKILSSKYNSWKHNRGSYGSSNFSSVIQKQGSSLETLQNLHSQEDHFSPVGSFLSSSSSPHLSLPEDQSLLPPPSSITSRFIPTNPNPNPSVFSSPLRLPDSALPQVGSSKKTFKWTPDPFIEDKGIFSDMINVTESDVTDSYSDNKIGNSNIINNNMNSMNSGRSNSGNNKGGIKMFINDVRSLDKDMKAVAIDVTRTKNSIGAAKYNAETITDLKTNPLTNPSYSHVSRPIYAARLDLAKAAGAVKSAFSLSLGPVPDDNPFIEEVYTIFNDIGQYEKIVGFNGHQVKRLFSPASIEHGIELSSRANYSYLNIKRVHRWGVVQQLLQESLSRQKGLLGAIPLFNENKLGDFYELITNEYRHRQLPRKGKGELLNRKEILSVFENETHPVKFVWINSADENWGFFSTPIANRTTRWINMTNHLRIHQADYDTVKVLIDSRRVAMVVVNSHVDPLIGTHEKIIPLPLGVNGNHKQDLIRMIIKFVKEQKTKKKKLLYINNSGWGDRVNINRLVAAAFNKSEWHPLTNMYSHGKSFDQLALEIATSKFVLCPSGLGFDTYRLWETIMLGSIPVVESNAGFDRAYSRLPVLVVRDFADVTPNLLERVYPCFYRNARQFSYEHLTRQHWFQLINNASRFGSSQHTLTHHPFRNPICSVL